MIASEANRGGHFFTTKLRFVSMGFLFLEESFRFALITPNRGTFKLRKDFGLKKNTSRQVLGEVRLDGTDVVIDRMWLPGSRFKRSVQMQHYVTS